ncbi:MAG: hypothetical protein E7K65_15950, partial [Pseudomonas sp.]|nr:hypothetical protein [Pseudomonas sp.]
MIKTNTSAPQLEKPMIFPAEDYARAWVGCLAGFLPGLKDRSREVFLRLSGWHHWNAMVEACNPEQNCVFMTEDLSPELRLSTLAEHRSILIHEFGVKPATANFFLWANPLGSFELVPLRAAVKESLYQEGESPSSRLDKILIALDQENRALVPGTEENHRRGCHFTNERVYMAMFQHLGWNLELSDGRDYDVPFGLP